MNSLSPSPASPSLDSNSSSSPDNHRPRRITRSERSDFYLQARSLSELALHNLNLADMFTDEDLLDSLAPLGTGVVEEAEEMFRDRCNQALQYAATPARTMADHADPSYFALDRDRLYSDGGDSSYSSGVSTPSLYSSYAESGVGSPLPATPANERDGRHASYSCTGSPTLLATRLEAQASVAESLLFGKGAGADAEGPSGSPSAPTAPTIVTRRSGLALKLELPLLPTMKPLTTSASYASLRDRGAPAALVSRATKSPAAQPALSPLSAPSSPRVLTSAVSTLSCSTLVDLASPVTETAQDAAAAAAAAAAPVDEATSRGPSPAKPSWIRDLEQRVAPADGIKLKGRRNHTYAF
ncbi:hypothetical protein JCM8202v2_001364 [Rhodotorula sphaerocarpa]